jgi:hypothetical protein
MARDLKYPREWLERVSAVVFACLIPGEIRIILHPGVGLADGGTPRDVPVEQIPFDLRMPNTPLWIQFDEDWNILRVWRREVEEADGG